MNGGAGESTAVDFERAEGERGGEGEGGRGRIVSEALRESEGVNLVKTERVEGDRREGA